MGVRSMSGARLNCLGENLKGLTETMPPNHYLLMSGQFVLPYICNRAKKRIWDQRCPNGKVATATAFFVTPVRVVARNNIPELPVLTPVAMDECPAVWTTRIRGNAPTIPL